MLNAKVKQQIKNHYDIISPYYQKLWGNHIHHGYYLTGEETKEEATENLIKLLVERSGIERNSDVLDIGCGIGGTSIWLAKNYGCNVTGITISPVQVEMAEEQCKKEKLNRKPTFFVSDANYLNLTRKYNIIWSIEMISHLENRKEFLEKCAEGLEIDGKLIIADWFKDSGLNEEKIKNYIKPIEEGMMVSLWTSEEYREILEKNKLKLRYHKDISENVKKTWDVCLDIIKKKEFWSLVVKYKKEFVHFLKAFNSMKKGFDSKAFRYEVMVFEK